ncbi:hypothetical protein HDU82_005950 [Entophlyctis luteolus]|nr:hypothetical protein HDU82_005950 [Entophlyctis luteolus]
MIVREFPFSSLQLLYALDESGNEGPATCTPYIFPEIWSRIFIMAYGNMRQLYTVSWLCKSVYLYCWASPAAKSFFLIERYGKANAVFHAFTQKLWRCPQFHAVFECLVCAGARYACAIRGESSCPVVKLCLTPNATELVTLFWKCKPIIRHEHMHQALRIAVGKGDFALESKLTKAGKVEFAMTMMSAINYSFNPTLIAFAIENKLTAMAKALIDAAGGLTEEQSNAVWSQHFNRETITIALEVGVLATQLCLWFVTSQRTFFRMSLQPVELHVCEKPTGDLNKLFARTSFVLDLLLSKNAHVDKCTLSNASATGCFELVNFLLEKWQSSPKYGDICVVTRKAIHNAFARMDWTLVELLMNSRQKWFLQFEPENSGIKFPVTNTYIHPRLSPPRHDYEFFFENFQFLVELNVYDDSFLSSSIAMFARESHSWTVSEKEAILAEFEARGSKVDANCLFEAAYDKDTGDLANSDHFKFFLSKLRLDDSTSSSDCELMSWLCRSGRLERNPHNALLLKELLDKGILPSSEMYASAVLRSASELNITESLRMIVEFSVSRKDKILQNFFFDFPAIYDDKLRFDYEVEDEELKVVFEYLWKQGFRCGQNTIDEYRRVGLMHWAQVLDTLLRAEEAEVRRIAVIAFPGVDDLDLIGPLRVLRGAFRRADLPVSGCDCKLLTFAPHDPTSPVETSHGVKVMVDGALADADFAAFDLVLVPGGEWISRAATGAFGETQRGHLPALLARARAANPSLLFASVCTGALLLAHAGVLPPGSTATTHHAARADLAALGINVSNARVVIDPACGVLSGGGVSSGIDVALNIISKIAGSSLADRVAAMIEYEWFRV